MARQMPSLVALLGLLAVAGYQHRDKIADLLGGGSKDGESGSSDVLGRIGDLLVGDKSPKKVVDGGLGDLIDQFKQSGQQEAADSWVKTGPNQEVTADQLRQALGPDVLADVSSRTGLSVDELVARLSRTLPDAVDRYTPDGRLPT